MNRQFVTLWMAALFIYLVFLVIPKTNPPSQVMEWGLGIMVVTYATVVIVAPTSQRSFSAGFAMWLGYGVVSAVPIVSMAFEFRRFDIGNGYGWALVAAIIKTSAWMYLLIQVFTLSHYGMFLI